MHWTSLIMKISSIQWSNTNIIKVVLMNKSFQSWSLKLSPEQCNFHATQRNEIASKISCDTFYAINSMQPLSTTLRHRNHHRLQATHCTALDSALECKGIQCILSLKFKLWTLFFKTAEMGLNLCFALTMIMTHQEFNKSYFNLHSLKQYDECYKLFDNNAKRI
jgi:hypothetical protein